MSSLVWVGAPLVAYAVVLAARFALGRPPSKRALNIESSLLLLAYLATTLGLGVFWVANQQLPVFDIHYFFGYATALLAAVHLWFNLRIALRHFRTPAADGAPPHARKKARAGATVGVGLGLAASFAGAFLLGMRHGRTELRVSWSGDDAAGASAAARGPVAAIERYHAASSHSRAGVIARAPSVDWGSVPPALKSYPPELPRMRLPEPPAGVGPSLGEALRGPAAFASLDVGRLSGILHAAAGITARRGGLALRASPSSGALFSAELYVVVRTVTGVDPGTYHYDPDAHGLVRIGDAGSDAMALGAAASTALEHAGAVAVVTSIFRRTGHKYRDRAYRYVTADLGHLLENLRVGAAAHGIVAEPLRAFAEDRVSATLRIDETEEGVIALVPLTTARFEAPQPRDGSFRAPGASETAASESGALGVTGLVHLATSLRTSSERPASKLEGAVPLPAPAAATALAIDTIERRRSARSFDERSLSLEDLGSVLADATRPAASLSDAVRVHVVANRVEGLERGAYRLEPRAHALVPTRRGDLEAEARDAALSQEVIGGAAAVLVLTLDREAVFAADGARGYRHGMLEAGMIGERVLLGAVARGLGACPVGAFYDEEAVALLGVDAERQWPVHFIAIGR